MSRITVTIDRFITHGIAINDASAFEAALREALSNRLTRPGQIERIPSLDAIARIHAGAILSCPAGRIERLGRHIGAAVYRAMLR